MVPNHQPVFISSGPVIFWCVFFFRSSKYPIVPESPKKTVVHPHWWKSHHLINSLLPTAGARIPSYQYIFGFVQGNSFMKPLFLPANIAGWWLTYPSEKYDSQLGWWHSKYMEKKTCSKPPTSSGVYQNGFFGNQKMLPMLPTHFSGPCPAPTSGAEIPSAQPKWMGVSETRHGASHD